LIITELFVQIVHLLCFRLYIVNSKRDTKVANSQINLISVVYSQINLIPVGTSYR